MMKQTLYRFNPRWKVCRWRSRRWSSPVRLAGLRTRRLPSGTFALGLAQCGLFGDALVHANAMFRIATEIEDPQRISGAHYARGFSYLLMLQADLAIQEFEPGLTIAKEFGSSWMIGNTTTELAMAYLLNDQPAGARTLLDSVCLAGNRPSYESGTTHALGKRHTSCWQRTSLPRHCGSPNTCSTRSGDPQQTQPIPALSKLHGEALLALKQFKKAERSLEAAKQGAEDRQALPLLWQIHAPVGRAA